MWGRPVLEERVNPALLYDPNDGIALFLNAWISFRNPDRGGAFHFRLIKPLRVTGTGKWGR